MEPQLVVVIGATGAQGGSVVAELLQRPDEYRIRAITRDASKTAVQTLAAQGVDVKQASLDDGCDALTSIFSGASIIFGMTDFWASGSSSVEIMQGIALADAAAATKTLKHFIWTSLPDPVKLSQGKLVNIHHWKSKNDVTEYIRTKQPNLWSKTTTLLLPNYFENCETMPNGYLPKNLSGVYTLRFPHSPSTVMPNVAIKDTGKIVRAVIEHGTKYFEKTIAFSSQALSEAEKLSELGKILQVQIKYEQLTSEEFQQSLLQRGLSPEAALDLAEQLKMFEDFGNVYAHTDFIQATDVPGLSLTTWSEYIRDTNLLAIMQKTAA